MSEAMQGFMGIIIGWVVAQLITFLIYFTLYLWETFDSWRRTRYYRRIFGGKSRKIETDNILQIFRKPYSVGGGELDA